MATRLEDSVSEDESHVAGGQVQDVVGPRVSRYLPNVIDQMLTEIPTAENEFIQSLLSLKSSAEFSAPELMGLRWRCGAEIMSDHISQDEKQWSGWQRRVVAIWMGQ